MKASFVYVVGNDTYVLDRGPLDFLDQLTYRNFKSRDDIFTFPRYAERLKDLPVDGEFYMSVELDEFSEEALKFICLFGERNPFASRQLFNVIYNGEENREKVFNPRVHIAKRVAQPETFTEFYEKTKELYTAEERFFHEVGMIYEDNGLATECVKRVLSEALSGRGKYLMCRIFDDGLSRFDSESKKETDNKTYRK